MGLSSFESFYVAYIVAVEFKINYLAEKRLFRARKSPHTIIERRSISFKYAGSMLSRDGYNSVRRSRGPR